MEPRIQAHAHRVGGLEERLTDQGTEMLNRKARHLAAAGAIAPAALLFALGTTGASAAPLTAHADPSSCTTGASSGNVTTCMVWSNSGQNVFFIDATATVNNVARELTVCIHGPLGTIRCDPEGYVTVPHGGHIAVEWAPGGRRQFAGEYCVYTWRKNANGTNTRIGDVCTTIP